MRIIDRLSLYLDAKRITPYAFERLNQVANGYLKKQQRGKGTIGSDIVERIHKNYPDLNLVWLFSGLGDMILDAELVKHVLQESRSAYTRDERTQHLQDRIAMLESALADKVKIISMLEQQIEFTKQRN